MASQGFEDRLYAALREAGMPDVPESFSVAHVHQEIPRAIMSEIEDFIRLFDRVTTRPAWQDEVTASGPEIARKKRSEVCFFSAWDFHLPADRPEHWQLIECNDNGSGLMFAAILNRLYYELSSGGVSEPPPPPRLRTLEPPMPLPAFSRRVANIIRGEAEAFCSLSRREAFVAAMATGLVLILDDVESLRSGKFRHELVLTQDLCRHEGWRTEIGSPEETTWDGRYLMCRGERVSFVVNRSTDFFLEADVFSALRAAYADGSVFIAPNPFTYATRSDKRLLELLSRPVRDAQLGITSDERLVLSAHVPETQLLRPDNVEELARTKEEWFFKPCHGFASHGLLTSAQVGRTRLRRLLKKGDSYIAQRRAPKSCIEASHDGVPVWTDLRVWAYRGERLLLSGRASRNPDTIDLSSPGGWLPTYANQ